MDYQLYGLEPRGYHLTNLFLHVVSVVLLFVALRAMTGARWPSALVAALFGIHPLHVESVAWVSERKDVLSALFWMLTLWAYARYAGRPHWTRYAPVVALFLLGLLAKPMLVTLPFVLLLLDYWPLGRLTDATGRLTPHRLRPLVLEKLPLFALAAAASVITYVAQSAGGAVAGLERFPFSVRVMNAVVTYLSYLTKMIWPADLAIRYPHPGGALPVWQAGAAGIVLVAVSIAVVASRRKPYLAVGWFWYVGTLVPVIGLVQVGDQAMADRYTYLPLVGVFVIIAWCTADLVASRRPLRPAVAGLALASLIGLMIGARIQVGYWRDGITLYERTLAVSSGDALLHYNLANELRERGRGDEALAHYSDAIRLNPNYTAAYTNAGPVLATQGRIDEAIASYAVALRIDPNLAEAHNNLGMLLAEAGRIDEAIAEFSAALRLKPDLAGARRNLDIARALQVDAGASGPLRSMGN